MTRPTRQGVRMTARTPKITTAMITKMKIQRFRPPRNSTPMVMQIVTMVAPRSGCMLISAAPNPRHSAIGAKPFLSECM